MDSAKNVWNHLRTGGRYLNRHGRVWWLVLGIVVGMLFNIMPMIMMMMAGFGGGGGMPSFPTAVEVALVKQGPLDDSVNVAGSLQADEGIVLKSEVNGRVDGLPLEEGAKVEKGAMLVVLDDQATKAGLADARARARFAARNFERLKKLRAQDEALVSQRDFDNALSAKEVADAAVQVAMADYDKTHIAAPFAGTVGLRQVSVGQFVGVGQDLVSLQALDVLKVDFSLPERFAPALQPGSPVAVTVDALGNEEVSATVLAVDPLVDPATRNVGVRAVIDNADGALRPGMFVRVNATLARKDDALTIPEEAIVPEGNEKFVFKVVDGKAVKAKVQLGLRLQGTVEVTGGLKKDDLVVTAGQMKVHDGGDVVTTNLTTAPVSGTVVPRSVPEAADEEIEVSGTAAVSPTE